MHFTRTLLSPVRLILALAVSALAASSAFAGRTLQIISTPTSVTAGQYFTYTARATTDIGGETIAFFYVGYQVNGPANGSITWVAADDASGLGSVQSVQKTFGITAPGGIGQYVMVAVQAVFRGPYGDVAFDGSSPWGGWSSGGTPPRVYQQVTVANTVPTASVGVSGGAIYFGQTFDASGTLTDPDGNLQKHGLLVNQNDGAGWRRPTGADYSWWNMDNSSNWVSFTGNLSGNVASGSYSNIGGTYRPSVTGTMTVHTNGHDGINWASENGASTIYAYVTVNKATPTGSFSGGGARTPPVGSSAYSIVAADLNAGFSNPYSGSVSAPTGTVTYAIAPGSPAGTPGSAVSAGTALPGGYSYTIRATYSGDGNYNSATVDSTFTINKATQNTVTITSSNSSSYGNAYTATATGGNGAGAIAWTLGSGSTAAGAAINASTGAITANSTGTVVIRAYRAADSNFNQSATTADFIVTFGQRAITVTLGGSKAFDNTTAPTGASANVTSGSLAPGDVIGYSYANTSSPNVGSYSGLTTANVTNATTPTTRTSYYAITYGGSYTITKKNQTITFGNPGNRNYYTFPQSFGLTATSDSGLAVSFAVTAGNATIAGSTLTVNGPGSITLQATQAGDSNYNAATAVNQSFTATQVWDLTVAAGTGGSAGTNGTFANGANAPLSATPSAGYRFLNWSGATGVASSTSASTTIAMTSAKSVTANFLKVFTVSLNAGGGGGVSGSGTQDINSNPTISATPNAGYRFLNWSGPDVGLVANANAATTTVNVTKDISLTANFIQTFTLAVTSNAGGTGGGSGTYDAGSTAYASVTVNSGYVFAGWNGANASFLTDTNASPSAIVMNGNYTVNANVISSASVVEMGVLDVGQAVISSAPVGNKNSQRDLTMQNTGNVAVTVSNYVVDSSAAPGEFTMAAAPKGTIAASASTVSTVNFKPGTTVGTRGGGLLVVSDDTSKPFRHYTLTAEAVPPPQTITFAQPSDQTYGNAPFAVSGTASSGLSVTFTILSGPATISGSTVTLTGNGTVVVRASQAGNASWAPAPNVDRTFNVAKASLTVTLTGGKIVDGSTTPTGATASITSGTLAAGDTIAYGYGNTSAAGVGSYSGLTTATISNGSAPTNRTASYTITYAGTYTISKASPAMNFPAITDTYVGQSKTLAGSLTGGFSPSGSITYSILSSTGGASGTISPATTFNAVGLNNGNPGTVTIRASYAGDAANNSVFADRLVNIPNREPSAVSGGAVGAITFGNTVSVPVNLTDPDGNCNGYTVQVYDPSSGWGSVTTTALANTSSQSISYSHTPTGAGTWQYRFAATDAVGLTGTTQYTVSVVVNKAATTTTASYGDISAVANRFPSDAFTLTSATTSNVTGLATGTRTYSVQSITNITGASLTVGAAVTSPFSVGGTATRPSSVVDHGEADAYGTVTILVSYAGDANYLPSSTTVSFTVVNPTYLTDLRVRAYPTDTNLRAWLLPSAVTQNNYTLQRPR